MIAAQFENLLDAAIYRRNHGGWLFVTDRGEAFWFCAAHYTASVILLHRLVKGREGNLICDNRYIKAA